MLKSEVMVHNWQPEYDQVPHGQEVGSFGRMLI